MEEGPVPCKRILVKMKKRIRSMPSAKIKMDSSQEKLEKGDLVLIVDDRVARNHWPLARIVHTYPDEEGYVRSVKVTTRATFLDRPVDKLILILERNV